MGREILRVKRARLLSQNQIREITMGSDSDEDKYYASEGTEDEQELRPPSRQSSISQPASPDFSGSSSVEEDAVGSVTGQQPQPSLWTLLCGHRPVDTALWTLPPKTRRRVVHTFIGAPNGKGSEAAHITRLEPSHGAC
jgi:hypothetical protein